MGNSAACRIQHSQDISSQERKKIPGLVRPQRPGATDRAEQKRTRPPENVANQKSDWWERKAVELPRPADRNTMKGFYNELNEVCEPKKKGYVNLKPTYGIVTYSDSKRVVARWNKHSMKLLNVPGDIDHETLEKSRSAIPRQTSMRFQPWMRWLEQSPD